MQYRNEVKHVISRSDKAAVCASMRAVAKADEHAGPGGVYHIRSLYFDTPGDRALREKLDGVNEREKFRIRLYNGDTGMIRLEKKGKRSGMCYKMSERITEQETRRILAGDIQWMAASGRALLVEFYAKMRFERLWPKTIVDYDRTAFVYGPGNVRVTVDENIRTGLGCTDLLDPHCLTIPAGDGEIILEVKWDEYLPENIRRAVALKSRRAAAFSKYQTCRKYD